MKEYAMTERDVCIVIGKTEDETQVTDNDTGWSEEEKEDFRRRAAQPYWKFFNWDCPSEDEE